MQEDIPFLMDVPLYGKLVFILEREGGFLCLIPYYSICCLSY